MPEDPVVTVGRFKYTAYVELSNTDTVRNTQAFSIRLREDGDGWVDDPCELLDHIERFAADVSRHEGWADNPIHVRSEIRALWFADDLSEILGPEFTVAVGLPRDEAERDICQFLARGVPGTQLNPPLHSLRTPMES